MKHEFMDFSQETCFREELLQKIKAECFAALDDDDLSFVNAAGVPDASRQVVLVMPEMNGDRQTDP